jgi:hypothetical protein
VSPTSAVDVFVTSVIAAQQAAQGSAFDLTAVQYPLACVVPRGEGSATRNEAVLYRDNQRSVGLPLGYAPPTLTTTWVSVANAGSEALTPQALCASATSSSAAFGPAVPVTGSTALLVAQTVGTVIRLAGSNFGATPVVTAGLSVAPAFVCTANDSSLVFIVPPGQGSGGEDGYQVTVRAADQSSFASTPLRLRYADPIVASVTPSGPTMGGVRITVTGSNFGVGTPSVWLGPGPTALAPCTTVNRTSHSSLSCTLPEGSGSGLGVHMSVGDLPLQGLATGPATFSYNPPVIASMSVTLPGEANASPAARSLGNGSSSSTPVSFTWEAVLGSAASPLRGPTQGGFNVTLTGSDFGPEGAASGDVVVLVGADRVAPTLHNHTTIVFVMPPGVGQRDVSVEVKGQVGAGLAANHVVAWLARLSSLCHLRVV